MKRIAVVEDEVYMRKNSAICFKRAGMGGNHRVGRCRSAPGALRPDLVILDLNLPEISGFQICQELKNKTAIPVLILTSRDQVNNDVSVPLGC